MTGSSRSRFGVHCFDTPSPDPDHLAEWTAESFALDLAQRMHRATFGHRVSYEDVPVFDRVAAVRSPTDLRFGVEAPVARRMGGDPWQGTGTRRFLVAVFEAPDDLPVGEVGAALLRAAAGSMLLDYACVELDHLVDHDGERTACHGFRGGDVFCAPGPDECFECAVSRDDRIRPLSYYLDATLRVARARGVVPDEVHR